MEPMPPVKRGEWSFFPRVAPVSICSRIMRTGDASSKPWFRRCPAKRRGWTKLKSEKGEKGFHFYVRILTATPTNASTTLSTPCSESERRDENQNEYEPSNQGTNLAGFLDVSTDTDPSDGRTH